MTTLPSPLAYVLETVAEVRAALRVVPQLYEAAKYAEAAELVDDMAIQLRELDSATQALRHGGDPSLEALTPADRRVSEPPLTRPGGRPGEPQNDDFVDAPLW